MDTVLGIDTSSTDLGIGIFRNGRPLCSFSRFVNNSHAEHISDAVVMLMKLNSVNPQEITSVAVATGPGSFTGLRIGISFIKGFCIETTRKVLPLSTLHVMAHSCKTLTGKRVFSAIDARNDEVFWACFQVETDGIKRVTDDTLSSAEILIDKSQKNDIIITDRMGFSRSTVFTLFEGKRTLFPVENYPIHRGFLVADIGAATPVTSPLWRLASDIEPDYMRPSYAPRRKEIK